MALRYNEEVDKNNTLKLRKMLANLPESCSTFMRGIEQRTESRTRIAYAYDLRMFFRYLEDMHPELNTVPMMDWEVGVLDEITKLDIEEYLEHCEL